MDYIKDFHSFSPEEQLNEKLNWKHALIATAILINIPWINNVNKVRKIYNLVNSESSIPTQSESIIIDSIRYKLIDIIEQSDDFNKYGKDYILDSLRTINFRVVDEIRIGKDLAAGMYLKLHDVKEYTNNRFITRQLLSPPNFDNCILILKSRLNDPDIAETIVHEMYHYFDRLLGENDGEFSDNINFDDIKDDKISNKDYALNKLSLIFFGKKYNEVEYPKSLVVDETYDFIKSEEDYYYSNHEMYVRWKTLKFRLLQRGIITDINQEVKYLDILNMLHSSDSESFDMDDVFFLFSIRSDIESYTI